MLALLALASVYDPGGLDTSMYDEYLGLGPAYLTVTDDPREPLKMI